MLVAIAFAVFAAPVRAQQPQQQAVRSPLDVLRAGREAQPTPQMLPDMYGHDSVRDIFTKKLDAAPQRDIEYELRRQEWGLARKKRLEKERADLITEVRHILGQDQYAAAPAGQQVRQNPAAPNAPVPQPAAAQPPVDEAKLSPAERIYRKYGDPSQPYPVKAQDTAPAPFKAMLECLNVGDDECAFKYAVQQVRYEQTLNNTLARATAIEGHAMRAEDQLPPGSWPDDPQYADLAWTRDIKVDDGRKQSGVLEEDPAKRRDREMAAALAKRKEREHDLLSNARTTDPIAKELNEQQERAKARRLGRQIPRDPQGEVDVYFFLKPYSEKAAAMAADVERLYQRTRRDKRLNFTALFIDEFDGVKEQNFRDRTKVTFPIVGGAALAKQLGITGSPTLMFVARGSKRQYTQEGLSNFYYMDELLNMMQGS